MLLNLSDDDGAFGWEFPTTEILIWLLMSFLYHSLVVIFAFGGIGELLECGPRWGRFKVELGSVSTLCGGDKQAAFRIARVTKCRRRVRARRGPGCMNWHCPFSKIYLPPPLPYRRNKPRTTGNDDNRQMEGWDSESSSGASDSQQVPDSEELTTTVSPQPGTETVSQDGVDPGGAVVSQDPTAQTKKKKRKKRRKKEKTVQVTQVPSTSLLDLARMQHWSLVVKYASKEGASRRDYFGLIALHWACSGSPSLEAVEALLKVYPEGAEETDSEGSTALHFACHYGASHSVVELLLKVNKSAICARDVYGRSPLFHAVDKSAGEDILRSLIHADPSMVLSPCIPKDPAKAKRLKVPLPRRTPLFLAWHAVVRDRRSSSLRAGKIWDKAKMLLEAAYRLDKGPQAAYMMLHAAVSLDRYLPAQVVTHALQLFPDQIKQRDQSTMGRLPLAIASSSDQLTEERSRDLIRLLVAVYPRAATIPDDTGSYPLSLALSAGKSWVTGAQDIFEAAPDMTHRKDPGMVLFPTLVAASTEPPNPAPQELDDPYQQISSTFHLRHDAKSREWQRELLKQYHSEEKLETSENSWKKIGPQERQLSTIFSLLRADPAIVSSS